MHVSAFEVFKVGVGPSSSHTVAPMHAARLFARCLDDDGLSERVARLRVELFGSLGYTGRGHGSDRAVLLGLEGGEPSTVDLDAAPARLAEIERRAAVRLPSGRHVGLSPEEDLVFHRGRSSERTGNALRFTALDGQGATVATRTYLSVGGGCLADEAGRPVRTSGVAPSAAVEVPFPFDSASALLAHAERSGLSLSSIMLANEAASLGEAEVRRGLLELWAAMAASVQRGCAKEGILPGGLRVKRRAASLARRLKADARGPADALVVLDWVNLWALAVNEENAAGGRIVTAPTNGAAGIVPAVLTYFLRCVPNADDDGVVRFLLTAAAIAGLYKKNASISGAEVGCQGEVGVACSMAAGALAEVMGGTPQQVENAAEIAMEHNLGLTCDPINGLVQVPCIERNAMGSVKAINAARLALSGDGRHLVSLDRVIETMRRTGADMSSKYKETARGGLAVNVTEC